MNINATYALVGGGTLQRSARETVDEAEIPRPRRARPPVERVIEGELFGRQSERSGASADDFARRLRMMANAAAGNWPQTDARNRAGLAAYADIAAARGQWAAASRLDLYV